jgi:Asp-tRNA(Asn)/Glu-tRNA(Gln) amidotransferase A subunit family amidase
MTLAWSMDKIGPMCRAAEDCALVLDAIQGPDGQDNTVLDVPFNWDATSDLTELKVGYPRAAFEEEIDDDERTPDRVAGLRRIQSNNRAALDVVRGLGVQVVPFDLPDLPASAIGFILGTEAAAAFDAPTLSAALDGMRELPEQSRWPDSLRASRFVPAVEYLQANRLRMRFMEMVHEALGDLDLFIGSHVSLTNLTGHPEVSLPNGFHRGSPTSLRLTGKLFGEAELLRLAHAYQGVTAHHLQHPTL